MKITKRQLRQIIREEKARLLKEQAMDPRSPNPQSWEYEGASRNFRSQVMNAAHVARYSLEPRRYAKFERALKRLFDDHNIK